MVTHPKRLVFAGVFVVALAVTSYLPRLMQNALHHDQSTSDGYDGSGSAGGVPDGASGAVSADTRADASPARILQAVHDSLRRNDLESAEVLLRAARALDINNPQAIALQHDLDARMAQSTSPAAPARGVNTIQRAEPRSIPRTTRTVSRNVQKHERTQRVPLHTREANDVHANATATRNTPAETVAPVPEVVQKPKPVADTVPEVVNAPPLIIAPQPVVQQTVRHDPTPVVESSPGPKSRAEVRAELDRARADGSLPRFGNPDPAGPGVATISKSLPTTPSR